MKKEDESAESTLQTCAVAPCGRAVRVHFSQYHAIPTPFASRFLVNMPCPKARGVSANVHAVGSNDMAWEIKYSGGLSHWQSMGSLSVTPPSPTVPYLFGFLSRPNPYSKKEKNWPVPIGFVSTITWVYSSTHRNL